MLRKALLLLITFLIPLSVSAVASKKGKNIELREGGMKMLFKIDFREFDKDRITEFRFYNEPFVNITVLHDPGKNNPKFTSFDSSVEMLDKNKTAKVQKIYEELKKLSFKNNFPWKENFSKRGDIFYVNVIQEYSPLADSESSSKTIALPQVFIFYKGFKEDYPSVYSEIADLIASLSK